MKNCLINSVHKKDDNKIVMHFESNQLAQIWGKLELVSRGTAIGEGASSFEVADMGKSKTKSNISTITLEYSNLNGTLDLLYQMGIISKDMASSIDPAFKAPDVIPSENFTKKIS